MKVIKSVLVFLLSLLLLAGCGLDIQPSAIPDSGPQVLTGFEEVASYIQSHQQLPDNFITKEEAKRLGWDARQGNLHEVAPGKSIGGDIFRNREGKLPKKKDRIWYEADINYTKGHRGKDRIVFSNDGLIYKTEDHYETFEPIE
ncbi:ribonuclease domain-containing protein [Paenibacillus thiaminolyticus]|uniref:ribonuclease domain-containing protein n=1 Tax=Paenibacillus thiaminolyticus TaxID=49283 RepID=UPI0016040B9A|nr:ribonuclease domain-containing protein [Paenibacillus thiaminolyticus]